MKITLLGQGYEAASENSVGNYLLKFFSQEDFHTFTGISAFASEGGVRKFSEYIENAKKTFKSLNLIVGIDQDGTSQEALLEINNLNINSHIFYQRESPIFHPKIYLFEGDSETKLILGSSNLTLKGLFLNVETSLLVEFSNDDEEGQQLLSDLKEYFKGLFEFNDQNLFIVTPKIIDSFVADGVVPSEAARLERDAKRKTEKGNRKELRVNVPRRPTAKIPHIFRGKPKTAKEVSNIIQELEIEGTFQTASNSLVWQKRNLPSSDAQQVSGNTKITGVLRLGDAGFKIDEIKINRDTYFRNEVFGSLTWSLEERTNNSPLQVAKCKFNISINGKNIGEHELRISHDPERIAHQHNIPTTIHWGSDIIAYLKKNSVIGKTLSLYSPPKDSSVFGIVIE